MVKYFLTSATVLAAVLPLVAETETETVDGYTWSYRINGDTVELLRVSPNPSGTVVIPSSLGGKPVTSIGESAFDSCNDLVGVAIPNSVTNIGEYAFCRCGHLAGVTIPSSVAYVGFNAFYSCDNLTNIVVHAGTIANCAFSYCGSFAWENNKIPLSLTIGESVTNIGEQAFSFCYGLRDLTIPANVATIGWGAFDNVGVTNLFIDVEYVGRDGTIFSRYRGDGVPLTVVLGNHVKHVGNRFLYQETIDSLTIGENVETIGEYAFYECWGLTNVKIPDSVRDIGDWAFTKDGDSFLHPSVLTNVTFGCGVTNIGAYAFSGRSVGVTSVTIPESVQSIGDYAFSFCTNLTCIEFWGNAPTIGPCFANVNPSCTVYVKTNSTGWGVDIPGTWNGMRIEYLPEDPKPIFTIENGVLTAIDLNGATDVTIPNNVTSIVDYAFYCCGGLTSVTIPGSVTNIGDHAFANCMSLTNVVIPSSIMNIGYGVFRGCGLTSVTIPNGVMNIGESAFSECIGLTSVTIPNGVMNIGESAFSECYGLTSVTIPNGVMNIGEFAFARCEGLTSVTIPESVTNIEDDVFFDCFELKNLTVPQYVLNQRHALYRLFSDPPPVTNVTYSSVITNIGEAAFAGCGGLTHVMIPDGVTHIGEGAFSGCYGLVGVTIPNSVMDIGNEAFNSCIGLSGTLVIPDSVMRIGDMAFYCCCGLKSLIIGNCVTNIGEGAFMFCDGITDVMIGSNVKCVGQSAFSECYSLASVMFNGNAPTNDDFCFAVRNPSCTVYVKTNSTGWGVDIPGTWNGLAIQYMTPEIEWLADREMTADARAANGRTAAECYVLGLDPVDATNDFRIVSIEMVDGKPKVEWEPKTNRWTGAEIQAVLKGAESLDGEWQTVTEENKAGFRFFKVVVVP